MAQIVMNRTPLMKKIHTPIDLYTALSFIYLFIYLFILSKVLSESEGELKELASEL